MKLKCGIIAIVLISVLVSGGIFSGGYFIGKRQNTTINNNITNTAIAQSISSSYSISSVIDIDNAGINGVYYLDLDSITNIKVMAYTNGQSNEITNYIK